MGRMSAGEVSFQACRLGPTVLMFEVLDQRMVLEPPALKVRVPLLHQGINGRIEKFEEHKWQVVEA